VLCWGPFFQYWQTERFNLYNNENSEAVFRSVFYFMSTIMVICSLGISLFAGPLIRIMAAPEFHAATGVVPYLVFGTLFAALVEFANFGFLAKSKTGFISINAYIIVVVITVLYLFAIPNYGYMGAAVALMIAQAIYFYLSDRMARRFYDPGISVKPLSFMVAIAGAGCWMANDLLANENIWIDLAMKMLVFCGISGLLMLILVRDEEQRKRMMDITGMLVSRFRK
jgi:O-antigen/teichoic acid export membrane protein